MNRQQPRSNPSDETAQVTRERPPEAALSPAGRAFLVMTVISFLGFALAAFG